VVLDVVLDVVVVCPIKDIMRAEHLLG